MKVDLQRRVELRAEALQRIADSRESDQRRFLLAECVQTYLSLDEAQWQEFQTLLTTNKRYEGAHKMMATAFEQGVEKGRQEGREEGREEGLEQGLRRTAIRLLEVRFGELSAAARRRIDELGTTELDELLVNLLTATSLGQLGLQD